MPFGYHSYHRPPDPKPRYKIPHEMQTIIAPAIAGAMFNISLTINDTPLSSRKLDVTSILLILKCLSCLSIKAIGFSFCEHSLG